MSVRMLRPETVRLDLSRDDFLIVKKHLTAGEVRDLFQRSRPVGNGTGRYELDPLLVPRQTIIAYLVDWSFCDADGQPIVIRDRDNDFKAAALDLLPYEHFGEVLAAVEAYETDLNKARAEEKKLQDGANRSPAILPSPESSDGGTNGSVN
jgi:hypothetical protein